VTGWYRIGPEAGPLPIDKRLEDLDDEVNYVLHFIPGEARVFRVSVDGAPPMRMPVHTAIPVVSLIDALGVQFELPEGEWQLQLDGRVLDAFHILADHPLLPESVLSLRRIA
jgi:hypothetical protein